jgi:hypothetical protein
VLAGGVLFWLFLCIAVPIWASKWGRFAFGYFLLSFFLSPLVGAIVLLLRGKNEAEVRRRILVSGTRRPCPHCQELVLPDATKCRYCGTLLDPW